MVSEAVVGLWSLVVGQSRKTMSTLSTFKAAVGSRLFGTRPKPDKKRGPLEPLRVSKGLSSKKWAGASEAVFGLWSLASRKTMSTWAPPTPELDGDFREYEKIHMNRIESRSDAGDIDRPGIRSGGCFPIICRKV